MSIGLSLMSYNDTEGWDRQWNLRCEVRIGVHWTVPYVLLHSTEGQDRQWDLRRCKQGTFGCPLEDCRLCPTWYRGTG